MLEGVEDTELEVYLDDHPRVVPLFEIDIMETVVAYAHTTTLKEEAYELDPESIMELSRARGMFERRILDYSRLRKTYSQVRRRQ